MTPLLFSFLAGADKLEKTLRYQRLDERDRYFRGAQYEDRELDANGYRKHARGVYGSMSRTPGWDERDPGAVWNLVADAVQEITDWAVAGDSWCHLEVQDDDEAEDWINTVAVMTNMSDVIETARNYGGAQGVGCISFAVREGEFFLEAHNPKNVWPLAWRDPVRHRPSAVAMVYRGDNLLAQSDAELPLVCRYWDEQIEATYQRNRNAYGEWVWEETGVVEHGLGFCPVYWHPQEARDGAHEGVPDGEGCEGEVDEANELFAAAGVTTKRNAEDTLVIKENPNLNPGQVRKGGFNTIWATGGAEYLSQTGESAKICVELSEKRAQHVARRFGIVMVDVEQLGKATTGEALKRLFQRTIKTAGRVRRDWARGLIIPLCKGLLTAGRLLLERGLDLFIPPRVVYDEALGANDIKPRTPGKSLFVSCIWPDPFPPTMDDLQKMLTSAGTATGGKQVMSRRTAVAWLKASPLPISNVEDELRQIDEDAEASAELAAKAIGLGAEQPGQAGPVDDEDPVEGAGADTGDAQLPAGKDKEQGEAA